MSNKGVSAILAILSLATVALADAAKTQALLMAMGANGQQTRPYLWKQRTTVIRKGNPTEALVEELRFDNTGQLQRTTLARPEEKRMGPIRARKVAEVKDSVRHVMQLAGQYSSPQQLKQVIQKGEIWEGQHALRIHGQSLLLPHDEMTMLVDAATYLTTRVDVKTQYDGNPVLVTVDYQQIPNGPSMMTQMTVQIPKENIVVNVQAFDFMRLAGPSAF